jgi:hypothetical protein
MDVCIYSVFVLYCVGSSGLIPAYEVIPTVHMIRKMQNRSQSSSWAVVLTDYYDHSALYSICKYWQCSRIKKTENVINYIYVRWHSTLYFLNDSPFLEVIKSDEHNLGSIFQQYL